jgi:hypothetical protein
MKIKQRFKAPTPPFFKKLRTWGVIAATLGAAVLAVPVALPAAILTVAGYLTVAGTVAGTVSQAATVNDSSEQVPDGPAQ